MLIPITELSTAPDGNNESNKLRLFEAALQIALGHQLPMLQTSRDRRIHWDIQGHVPESRHPREVPEPGQLNRRKKPFRCKVKLTHNAQEHSLTGGRIQYIKELTGQEGFTRKLFGLSNSTITNGGSDMGMSEDTQVSVNASDGDGGELTAASEIPERADEERTVVNTSQQCGMAAEVEEGEDCQEDKMSDLEGNVGELKLNIVACVKEEACDALAAVLEGGHLEPSGGEELAALGVEASLSPRADRQHQAHGAGEENEDDLKPLECLHLEQVQSTESYQATCNLLQQTLTEFKTDVSQNLQRDNEILQYHLQRDNEILQHHLQRDNEILQYHLQRDNEILQHHLQRNNEILQQQNEIHCQLLQ
ncbi:hypothetical protein scyTo_0013737 [Scyliorhinus torazame]|uniref:Uncharacterized protein n=1 Tax=Scyliorhinus torazame TaxID=75743 RepID=A0A401P3N4_SCYTO|nr:hypothetical protein [Scyliorhinus torazame]